MGKLIDLTGQRFGHLTVIERGDDYISPSGIPTPKWKCQCDCGNIVDVESRSLRYGKTKSCGCSKGELISLAISEDLTGQKFNRLTVIKRGEDLICKSRNVSRWLCRCECGNETLVTTSSLKSGKTKSCGCLQKEITSSKCLDNLIGRTYGKLTVINRDENKHGKTYWKCKCECGNIVTVNSYCLKSGQTKSCGCINKELMSEKFLDDLTGQRFGRLTVIERAEDYIVPSINKHQVRWLCKCDCGNITYVTSSNLKNHKTNSCGCYKKEKMVEYFTKDITGQKFGKLTVIERVENRGGKSHWKCLCECGQETIISSNSLVSNKTMSCGCLLSSGEYLIKQYLMNNKIKYQSQKKFDTLLGLKNGHLSYDFYIESFNLLIEAQGIQHEKPIELFGGEEQFKIQQEHDRRKREYAENNGYRLLEIWYYDYDNIDEILDEFIKNISQPDCEGKNISC